MKTNIACFTAIYALVCYIRAAGADVNCITPPRHIPIHMCCPVLELNNADVIQKCTQLAGPQPKAPMTKENNVTSGTDSGMHPPSNLRRGFPPTCLAECFFNITEVMDENVNLNQEKFDELADRLIKNNTDLATVAKLSFATCASKISGIKEKIAEKLKEHREYTKNPAIRGKNPVCAPIASMIWACVNMEMFRNCPTSAWNNNEECNASREFVKECKKDKN